MGDIHADEDPAPFRGFCNNFLRICVQNVHRGTTKRCMTSKNKVQYK